MEQLSPVLITLLIAALTALTAWVERVRRDLGTNTAITQEAKEASNGRLSDALAQLATSRDLVQGLRYLVRERDDRIAYLTSRLPEAQALMRDYRDQRTARVTAADEQAAEQRAMSDK
jgi:hypothetical protein